MKMKRTMGPVSIDYIDTRVDDSHDGKATLTVIGVEMNCPLCGSLVPSGHTHECERTGAVTVRRLRKAKGIV